MISIVIPCYNCEKTIDYCLKSIKSQTKRNIEIVLVDDGSTDATAAICDREKQLDQRIRVIHQKNQGLMNAWKTGVRESTGTHIAFCDSDDYIDSNMLEELEKNALEYDADIVICGMLAEYEDGSNEIYDNRLEGGVYSKIDIQNRILPKYFSDGDMESSICLASRDVKLFKREILLNNFEFLDESITMGEDDLTTFAAFLCARKVVCIKDFYPYHYVRNNSSMIGAYDSHRFDKAIHLREALLKVAEEYNYLYKNQIEDHFISLALLCAKKEICRNKTVSYVGICSNLKKMRQNPILDHALCECSIKGYKMNSKIFALFFKFKMYRLLYFITKVVDLIGIGKA